MKNKILIIILFLTSILGFGQTQSEMNNAENQKFIKADKELNQVYSKILKDYKDDPIFISKLKIAQNLWIKFRDAEMDALFPESDKQFNYGSVFPMCWSIHLTKLTNERIKTLKMWSIGIEEGDVCSGSVKTKE
ncbi:lysozyme inhibitor LprI family protein [Flavobacterium mesophilum]|uniref:lysozyme inhibitor LprI family protein n=1 Tax=Flavobacterium mesophilum TaxID=3143495 RepID=UPI0031DEB0A7